MTQNKNIAWHTLVLLLLLTNVFYASAQSTSKTSAQKEEEIKLNENAVKMIQFDFTAQPNNKIEKMLEAPLEAEWKKFKEKVPFKRSFADTTTVKQIDGYVRATPYSIWNRYNEDPIESVMPTLKKKWSVYWKLTPYLHKQNEEYGKTIIPSTGEMYEALTAPSGSGVVIETDFNKLLFESLTARGRAIKHNRKYANAWKTYATYVPTREDSARYPRFWKSNQKVKSVFPILALSNDTTVESAYTSNTATSSESATKKKVPSARQQKKEKAKQKELEEVTTIEQYIRQRAAEDSIRRREYFRKDKERHNAYDIEKENRYYRDRKE